MLLNVTHTEVSLVKTLQQGTDYHFILWFPYLRLHAYSYISTLWCVLQVMLLNALNLLEIGIENRMKRLLQPVWRTGT